MLGTVCAVVVETDHLDIANLAYEPSVMLETKLGILRHLEGTVFPVQLPYDAPVSAVYLVDTTSVTRGYQIVAIRILVDTVDVEIVPSVGAVVARASLAGVKWQNSLCGMLG